MGKYFYAIICLFLSLSSAFSQEYYYWAYGKKYPLELFAEKQYVVTVNSDKESVAKGLGISKEEVLDLKRLTISKTIKNNRSDKSGDDNDMHWGFVNRSLTIEKVKSSEIIYAAPCFRVNGKEIGLSQFFYVKLKQEQDIEMLEKLAIENKVKIVGNDGFMPLWYILSCDKNSRGNALEMANLFYEAGLFTSAQPDLMEDYGVNCRNDTFFNQQWHLNNTGQSGGTVGNDIRICQAWDITMGCANVVVAVLDHGLEFNHPDFNNISPISFDTETGLAPSQVRGPHGVAVAGVIGATTDNGLGVAGVAPNVQLMSISNNLILEPLISQRLSNGINFAWQNGADVINNSWGHNAITQQELINTAINNAVTQGRGGLGTIVIFSTGNDNSNSISFPSNNVNTISVGAIGRTASRASFSNFGTGLDVVAPGVEITTTDREGIAGFNTAASPGGDITTVDGTSFAAPQVSGIAALILSVNPNLTLQQVRNIIESTTDKVGGVTYTLGAGEQAGLTWNNQMGYGRVNAFRAVQAALPTITGPALVCTNGSTFTLNNVPAGAQVTWVATPANLFSVSSGSGTNPMLSAANNNTSGQGTLTFTINTGCGNPIQIQRTSWVGLPANVESIALGFDTNQPFYVCPNTTYQFNAFDFTNITGTTYNWYTYNYHTIQSGQGTISTNIRTGNYVDGTYISVRAQNSCGMSYWTDALLYESFGCGGGWGFFSVYPNPSDKYLEVEISEGEYKSSEFTSYEILLLDNNGTEKLRTSTNDKSKRIDISSLKSGQYFINVLYKGEVLQRQIVINR